MTLSVTPQASPLATKLVQEDAANATPRSNVTGAPGSVFMIEFDNSPNAQAAWLKLYNSASPVVGTTAADLIVPIAANARRSVAIPQGLPFSVGISFAVTAGAAEANVASPVGPVIIRLATS
jgi:hypothetical protein